MDKQLAANRQKIINQWNKAAAYWAQSKNNRLKRYWYQKRMQRIARQLSQIKEAL